MLTYLKKIIALLTRKDNKIEKDELIILPPSIREVDVNKVTDIADQKTLCSDMLTIIKTDEAKLKSRFIGVQTVTDFIESDKKIKIEMSEYVGYHFGCITSNMLMVESALFNLKKFEEGVFDKIDASARGMFISLWYNIAVSNIELLDSSMKQIENVEADLIHQQMELTGSNEIILKRGIMH